MTSRMSDITDPEDRGKDGLSQEIDTYCETIQSNKSTLDDKTSAVQKGWTKLLDCYVESRTKDFPVLFDRLYLATAKLILAGEWYRAITENNYKNGEVLKNGLLKSLDALVEEVSNDYPMECKFCLNLKPLLDRSPWSLTYITDIIAPNSDDSLSAVEELWKEENETLVDVRLELLCSTKEYQKAFSIAQACYQDKDRSQQRLEDLIKGSSGNFRTEQLERRKCFNLELTNFFYLLLCVNVCRNKSKSDMEKFLSVPTAIDVVSHLSNISPNSNRYRLASKWKEWKKACKTIISTTTDFFIKQQLDDLDVDLTRRVFSYWIKHAAKNEEDIRPAKDLLDQINQINTDLIYVFADVLYENFNSRSSSVQKTVELYFRAMSKDINQIEKLDVTDNQEDKKQLLKSKLASRYLRLAKLFACDEKVSWELTLTAFSLNPSEELYKELFQEHPTDIVNTPGLPVFDLSPALKEDLQTVIANPRWKSLCWVKDKHEAEQLCRQQLDTGGPKIKAKEDLIHLHIDYEKYEPRQEHYDENDFGFEKGYEPKNFDAFRIPQARKKRGRGKSILLKKALPRRKPFPTVFNKQGKKKIYGVTQSNSTNQPSKAGIVSKGIAKKLSDIKQMRIMKLQSQGQDFILNKKRWPKKEPRVNLLYQEPIILNLGSFLTHLPLPLSLSDSGEAVEEERRSSSSFSRYTGFRIGCGNEDITRVNCDDFNSQFLRNVEDLKASSRHDRPHVHTYQTADAQELQKLFSEKYLDSFKLHPCFLKKFSEPLVELDSVIPMDFVQSSATNLAFSYIIQVMNKSLDAFWTACQNPAISETLRTAMETEANNSIPQPDIAIPKIVSEVCQYKGVHSNTSGLGGPATNFSVSDPSETAIKKQVGPRRTTNRRYAKRIIERASSTLSQNIAIKRQALGLQFINGNLIHASMLSDTNVNLQSVSSMINHEVNNEGYFKELPVPPDPVVRKLLFHRFEDFVIAQAAMHVTNAGATSGSELQSKSVVEVTGETEAPVLEDKDMKDTRLPTFDTLIKDDRAAALLHSYPSTLTKNPSEASCITPIDHEQGVKLVADLRVSSSEPVKEPAPLVCSIVKLVYGDCVRSKASPTLVETLQSPHESELDLDDDYIEDKSDANDSDYKPFTSPSYPLSPATPEGPKKKSNVIARGRPKPKRFKSEVHEEKKRKPKRKPKLISESSSQEWIPPVVSLPKLAVAPVISVPRKEVRVDTDALENHSKYIDGSNFLDHSSGYFETIGDLDLNFPSPESSEKLWDDTFGAYSDSEDQQSKSWLADWKHHNPEQTKVGGADNLENPVHTTTECEVKENSSTASELPDPPATATVPAIEVVEHSVNTTTNEESDVAQATLSENPETGTVKKHPIRPCFVLVQKLTHANISQDLDNSTSGKNSSNEIKTLSEAEDSCSIISNMDQPISSKVCGVGSSNKKYSTANRSGKPKGKPLNKARKGKVKKNHTSRKKRARPKPGPKSKRKSRKIKRRRKKSSDESEDSNMSAEIIYLDDSEPEKSESEPEDVVTGDSQDVPTSLEPPIVLENDMIREMLSEEQKPEVGWQKLEIARPEVIDVLSDKDEEVDPLDVSHVNIDQEDDHEKQLSLSEFLSVNEKTEELASTKVVSELSNRDYERRLSEDSNSSHQTLSGSTGESYLIVKSVGDDPLKLSGGDVSTASMPTFTLKTQGLVLVSDESSSCNDNTRDTDEGHNEEDDILKMMIKNGEDILNPEEEAVVSLSEVEDVGVNQGSYDTVQDEFEVEQGIGRVEYNHDVEYGNHLNVENEPAEEDLTDDEHDVETLDEHDIFIDTEELARDQTCDAQIVSDHANHRGSDKTTPMPFCEAHVIQTNGNSQTVVDVEEKSRVNTSEPSFENGDEFIMDRHERASEATTETETDSDELLDCISENKDDVTEIRAKGSYKLVEDYSSNDEINDQFVCAAKIQRNTTREFDKLSALVGSETEEQSGSEFSCTDPNKTERIETSALHERGVPLNRNITDSEEKYHSRYKDDGNTPGFQQKVIPVKQSPCLARSPKLPDVLSVDLSSTGSLLLTDSNFDVLATTNENERFDEEVVADTNDLSERESILESSLLEHSKDVEPIQSSCVNSNAVCDNADQKKAGDHFILQTNLGIHSNLHESVEPAIDSDSTSVVESTKRISDVGCSIASFGNTDTVEEAAVSKSEDCKTHWVENDDTKRNFDSTDDPGTLNVQIGVSNDVTASIATPDDCDLPVDSNINCSENVLDASPFESELASEVNSTTAPKSTKNIGDKNETIIQSEQNQASPDANRLFSLEPVSASQIDTVENVTNAQRVIPDVEEFLQVNDTTISACERVAINEKSLQDEMQVVQADNVHHPKLARTIKRRRKNKKFTSKKSGQKAYSEPIATLNVEIDEDLRKTQGSPDVNPPDGYENDVRLFGLQSIRSAQAQNENEGESVDQVVENTSSDSVINVLSNFELQGNDLENYSCGSIKPPADSSHSEISIFPNDFSVQLADEKGVSLGTNVVILDGSLRQGEEVLEVEAPSVLSKHAKQNLVCYDTETLPISGNVSASDNCSEEELVKFVDDHQRITAECNRGKDDETTHIKDENLPCSSLESVSPDSPRNKIVNRADTGVVDVAFLCKIHEKGLTCTTEDGPCDKNNKGSPSLIFQSDENNIQEQDQCSLPIIEEMPSSDYIILDASGQRPRKRRRRQVMAYTLTSGGRKSARVAENKKRRESDNIDDMGIAGEDSEVIIVKEVTPKKQLQTLVPLEEELSDLSNFDGDIPLRVESKPKRKRKSNQNVEKKVVSKSSISPDDEVTQILKHENDWDASKTTSTRTKPRKKSRGSVSSLVQPDWPCGKVKREPIIVLPVQLDTSDTFIVESSEASQRIRTPGSDKMPDIALELYSGLSGSPPTSFSPLTDKFVPSNSYSLRQRKNPITSAEEKCKIDSDENGVAPVLSPEIPTVPVHFNENQTTENIEGKKLALSPEITQVVSTKRFKRNIRGSNNVHTQSIKRQKKQPIEVIDLEHSESPPILSKPDDNATLLLFGETENCRSPLPPILEPEV